MKYRYTLLFSLFFIDRTCKLIAIQNPDFRFVYRNFFGWEYFANTGITFGIPVPMIFLQVATPIFILFLYIFIKNREKKYFFPFLLVFFGAISNYIDRVYYGITIDYIRIFSGVANIADFMVFIGIVYLISFSNKDYTV